MELPLLAGAELSVAATKSYIAMLSLSAIVIAHVQKDDRIAERAENAARRAACSGQARLVARCR